MLPRLARVTRRWSSLASPAQLESQGAVLCGAGDCFARRFVVPMRRIRPDGEFSLDDLVRGRVDLACRIISSAFFLSHDLRHNVEVALLLGPTAERALLVTGAVRTLRPDERSIAAVLRAALRRPPDRPGNIPGVHVLEAGRAAGGALGRTLAHWTETPAAWTLAAELREDAAAGPEALLEHLAERRAAADGPGTLIALLGDSRGLGERQAGFFREWAEATTSGVLPVQLGQQPLLGSHCVVLLHHYLDRAHCCPSKAGMP